MYVYCKTDTRQTTAAAGRYILVRPLLLFNFMIKFKILC